MLQMAKARLKKDRSALAEDVLILIPEDLELTALERELLDALPKEKLLVVGVDQPLTVPDDGKKGLSDAMLLRWLPSPTEAPAPKKDGTAEIFRAVGEVNEVREVFRRCLEARPISGRSRGSPHGYRNVRSAVLRVGLASPAGVGGGGQGLANHVRRGHPRAIQPAGAGADGLAGLGGR